MSRGREDLFFVTTKVYFKHRCFPSPFLGRKKKDLWFKSICNFLLANISFHVVLTTIAVFSSLWTWAQLWNSDHGHAVEACRDSSKKLQLDYLDLYLIHFPVATKHIGAYNTLFYCYYFIYLYKSVYISLRQWQ